MDELKEELTNGSLTMDKDTGKIALDYTGMIGQLDGLRMAEEMILNIRDIIELNQEEEEKL